MSEYASADLVLGARGALRVDPDSQGGIEFTGSLPELTLRPSFYLRASPDLSLLIKGGSPDLVPFATARVGVGLAFNDQVSFGIEGRFGVDLRGRFVAGGDVTFVDALRGERLKRARQEDREPYIAGLPLLGVLVIAGDKQEEVFMTVGVRFDLFPDLFR